jgi:cyclopropane-fatty-acyl-phospholipid synthase
MTELKPFYETVQSIYDDDHTTEWLRLFCDPTLLYSCAYFERDGMTLEEAQLAKLDLSLGKCDLRPGQTLLEIGCGWGACSFRAASKYGVNVIALTLSKTQQAYCQELMSRLPAGSGTVEVRLQGWEEYDGPVDRIVSIAAFEHFGRERHAPFFAKCRGLLPDDGRLMLHTIVAYDFQDLRAKGLEVTEEFVDFVKFLAKDIFPGGYLRRPPVIAQIAEENGFDVTRIHHLQEHYAQTLAHWAENLKANHSAAVAMKSEAEYERYMRYLTGCSEWFQSGHIDICQFTCVPKP